MFELGYIYVCLAILFGLGLRAAYLAWVDSYRFNRIFFSVLALMALSVDVFFVFNISDIIK